METKIYGLSILVCCTFLFYSCSSSESPFNTWNEKAAKPITQLTTDAVFADFLQNFKNDVESHNWNKVMAYFDSENFKSQRKLGIDTSQYIQEGLGLNFVNNKIKKKEKDYSVYSRINNIRIINFETYLNSTDDMIEIFGTVNTFGDDKLYVRLYCRKIDNRIVIIPPLG